MNFHKKQETFPILSLKITKPTEIHWVHLFCGAQNKTLNAVGETVFEKPSFRKTIHTKRCLLGINGFYEWCDFNKVKYPYFVLKAANSFPWDASMNRGLTKEQVKPETHSAF